MTYSIHIWLDAIPDGAIIVSEVRMNFCAVNVKISKDTLTSYREVRETTMDDLLELEENFAYP